ncbi:MAG: hypothetical protein WCA63_07030, partial [Gallionella sp.]
MNIIKDCWQGRCPLWQVFWVYYVCLFFALSFAFVLIFSMLDDSSKTAFIIPFGVFMLIYQVWVLVSVWRCANNLPRWRTLARFWV